MIPGLTDEGMTPTSPSGRSRVLEDDRLRTRSDQPFNIYFITSEKFPQETTVTHFFGLSTGSSLFLRLKRRRGEGEGREGTEDRETPGGDN